jgi:hypothetical protein
MFSLAKNFKDRVFAKKDTENQPKAKIFIWSGDPLDNVGHVSMEFADKNSSSTYLSIWPDKFPAVGPFAYFPLHAKLATNLEDDVKAESSGFSLEIENGSESLVPRHTTVKPDKEFSAVIPNADAMEKELKRIQSGVQAGKIRYQLFPNVHTTKTEVYNCATLVDHLLKVGGISSLPEKPVWRPSEFSEVLEKQSNISLKK